MKLYLVIVLVLCGSYADDELPEDFASLLSELSEDFKHQLHKRLTDLDTDHRLLDQDPSFDKGQFVNDKGSSCFYKVSEQRIIRTHDSLTNGATYIDSPTDIQNQTACREECCSHSDCDLAVFKAKGDEHACYLFACSGACLFTNHTGFTTMEKHRMAQQHETDLANLATDPPTSTTIETTTTTTTEKATTTSTPVNNDQVPLFGTCTEDSDCAGSRTECLAGYCVCQQGSHAQEGLCREECSRFQFECANEGSPLSYPQCIAIYDTCDGIQHCRDGSDELKCEPRGSSSSDAKTVLTGVGAIQDPLPFNDPLQLQPWQQQFLQQQQQQQLLKAGLIPQMLGQPGQPLYNIGQQPPSLQGFIPQQLQQIPQQLPQQVLLPLQGQNQLSAQVPAQYPMQINQQLAQGQIPLQNPGQNYLTSQGLGSEQDLSLLQQSLLGQNQPILLDPALQQQTNSNIQSAQQQPIIQQQQELNKQIQQQQEQQHSQSPIIGQAPNINLPQVGGAGQQPQQTSVGIPQSSQNQQSVQELQQQPHPANHVQQSPSQNKQGLLQAPVQAPQPQGFSPNDPALQQSQLSSGNFPLSKQEVQSHPPEDGGREVDFPAGHDPTNKEPKTQPVQIPVHADHMNRLPTTDDQNPHQQRATTVMPLRNQQVISSGGKASLNPNQINQRQQGANLNGDFDNDFINNDGLTASDNHRQQNGLDIRKQSPQNLRRGHLKKKPLGHISYTDGGAVVADSQTPLSRPNNGAGVNSQNPGSLAVPAQARQGDYGRGNWRSRIDPYLNSKTGYPIDQYGSKSNPHRGYSGDRYGTYNYESNPFPQGYPNNDQFYAYYDTDTPGSNTRTDYDYQYAADPSVDVDGSFDDLASLVEELLKDVEKGSAISQGGVSTDSGDDESNRDAAFWDYYDSSSNIPSNGQKTHDRGASNQGTYRGHQQGKAAGKVMAPIRPQVPDQKSNLDPGKAPGSDVKTRTDTEVPVTNKAHSSEREGDPSARGPDKPVGGSVTNDLPAQPQEPKSSAPKKQETPQEQNLKETPPQVHKNEPAKVVPAPKVPETIATGAPALETSSNPGTNTEDAAKKKPPHSGSGTGAVAKHVAPLEHIIDDAEKEPTIKTSNKTAVVVLAMGLAVTALLLIFVGCRLRMVKRRLRRGRPLNSNEADYLINGMYL